PAPGGGTPTITAVKVLIVGCGRVGSRLAAELDQEGHDVTIVDREPGAFDKGSARGVFGGDFRGTFVVGDGTDADLLRRAGVEMGFLSTTGVERADAVLAVTGDDEDNLIALQLAKKHFNVPLTIARVNNPANVEIFKTLGVDEAVSATEILLRAGSRSPRPL